jgi:pimeloyl-ACP methyl ester carboxylesterase
LSATAAAGSLSTEVAERVPDRVAMLVYLAAFLMPDGATLDGVSARGVRDIPDDAIVVSADGITSTVRPDQIGSVFYTTPDGEWAARAAAQLRPEPMAALATPPALGERFASVRRGYIERLRDRAVPIALQRAMQAELPGEPVMTLDTDHSPFFSAPADLGAALLVFA